MGLSSWKFLTVIALFVFQSSAVWAENVDKGIQTWCSGIREAIGRMHWQIDPCGGLNWKVGGASAEGRPLVYAEFGDPEASNSTLVFTMVHGDENTPLYFGIQLAHWAKEHERELKNARIVIAPLVNPDGFYRDPQTRTNSRGVDLNRNFLTNDWSSHALQAWRKKFRANPRRYPGSTPNSEPETVFQLELIKKFKPQKILSVHAPLNFIDYDGPTIRSLSKFSRDYVRECLKLRARLKAISGGFFPGSLGNYAGQERGIPTVTLELPTADPKRAEGYWNKFKPGINTMIEFKMPIYALRRRALVDPKYE